MMPRAAEPPNDGRYTLFVDEAGNTGRDLLNDAQPVYVLAGWFVHNEQIRVMEGLISDLRSAIAPGAEEIHATKVLKTRRGRDAFAPFLRSMGVVGGWPVFLLLEKRY